MQRYLYEHFNLPSHLGFFHTDPQDPTRQKDYQFHTLKTKAPLRLNDDDGL